MNDGRVEKELPEEISEALVRFEEQAVLVSNRDGWTSLRLEWLGKKRGLIRGLEQRIREVPKEERRDFGQGVNTLKTAVAAKLDSLDEALAADEQASDRAVSAVDVTLPGRPPQVGSLHPITRVAAEIEQIFAQLGFSVSEGPEVEDDFHNFEALNLPEGHPARDEQDTFFVEDGRVLRTAYLAGSSADHALSHAADSSDLPRPRVPQRQRPAALADVSSG